MYIVDQNKNTLSLLHILIDIAIRDILLFTSNIPASSAPERTRLDSFTILLVWLWSKTDFVAKMWNVWQFGSSAVLSYDKKKKRKKHRPGRRNVKWRDKKKKNIPVLPHTKCNSAWCIVLVRQTGCAYKTIKGLCHIKKIIHIFCAINLCIGLIIVSFFCLTQPRFIFLSLKDILAHNQHLVCLFSQFFSFHCLFKQNKMLITWTKCRVIMQGCFCFVFWSSHLEDISLSSLYLRVRRLFIVQTDYWVIRPYENKKDLAFSYSMYVHPQLLLPTYQSFLWTLLIL